MLYYGLTDSKTFWDEVTLRAKNNYGNINVVEEADVAVTNAIHEVIKDVEEMLQQSKEKTETYAGVALDFGIDLGM